MTNRKAGKIGILIALGLLFLGGAVFADPIEGYWKSIDEDGSASAFWYIEIRGGELFGHIVKIVDKPDDTIASKVDPSYPGHPESRDLTTLRVLDVDWIYGMSPRRNRPNQWTGGYIIDPNDGKRYDLDINLLDPGHRKAVDGLPTLEVKGKILVFSRSQYWVRSSLEEVQSFQ